MFNSLFGRFTSPKFNLEFIDSMDRLKDSFFIIHENKEYFSFSNEFDFSYDKHRIEIKVQIPKIIQELIQKIGIKEIKKHNKFYDKVQGKILVLNNNFKLELVLLREYEMSTMDYNQTHFTYTVGVTSENDEVSYSIKEKGEKHISNSYGFNFASHNTKVYNMKQFGLNEIFKILDMNEYQETDYKIKGEDYD